MSERGGQDAWSLYLVDGRDAALATAARLRYELSSIEATVRHCEIVLCEADASLAEYGVLMACVWADKARGSLADLERSGGVMGTASRLADLASSLFYDEVVLSIKEGRFEGWPEPLPPFIRDSRDLATQALERAGLASGDTSRMASRRGDFDYDLFWAPWAV